MYHEVIQYTRQRWKSGMVPQYADFWKKLDEFGRRKCTIGLLGEQSSGKSSFLNALIGYPLFTSSAVKTTVCPLALEYGSHPSLFVYSGEEPYRTSIELSGIFPENVFQKLVEYVCHIINQYVFYPENIGYFIPENKLFHQPLTAADILMEQNDPRHGLILALIALNSYFTPGETSYELQNVRDAAQKRLDVLQLMGISGDNVSFLKLQWNSDFLPPETVFLDLPGLGSDDVRKSGYISTDQKASSWAGRCDILFCMATPEVIGGALNAALTKLNSDDSGFKMPLTKFLINKADKVSVSALKFSRAAFREVAPFLKTSCYCLSTVAGEYRFVQEGIPVERTQFWEKFLSAYHETDEDIQISEKKKAQAVERLRKLYLKTYPCETADGNLFSLSLQDMLTEELHKLIALRSQYLFVQQFQSDSIPMRRMMELAIREEDFLERMNIIFSSLLGMWSFEAERGLQELEVTLTDVEKRVSVSIEETIRTIEGFSQLWEKTVQETNYAFCQTVTSICDDFQSRFGFVYCSSTSEAYSVSSKNNAVLQNVRAAASDFDVPSFLTPVLHKGDHIILHAIRFAQESYEAIVSATTRFSQYAEVLPDHCYEQCSYLGYDKSQFERYFAHPLSKLSAMLKRELSPGNFPGHSEVESGAVMEQMLQETDWKAIQSEWIKTAFDSAALLRNGEQWMLFSKRRLLHCLQRSFMNEQRTHTLTAPLLDTENSCGYLRQVLKYCEQRRNELSHIREDFTGKYTETIKLLLEEANQLLSRDYALLKQVKDIASTVE